MTDIRQDVSKIREGAGSQGQVVSGIRTFYRFSIHINCHPDSEQVGNFGCREARHLTFASSVLGELPPPPPRIFCGREELIEKVVHLAEGLKPIGLICQG